MVKILLGNLNSKIVGYLPESIHDQLDSALSYRIKNAYYMTSVKKKKWDGVYHLYKKNVGQSFYSGLLSLATEVLKQNSIEFILVDERIKPEPNLPHLKFTAPPFFEERDYQKFTIDRAIKGSRGVLKMATGAGKTMVVAQLIGKIQSAPFMFYVLTQDLMDQAYETLSSTLNEPIGRIGGGDFDIKKINVCTIQTAVIALNIENKKFNINDYKFDTEDESWDEKQMESIDQLNQLKKVIGAARGLYFDESHHTSARTVIEVLKASPFAYWRFGGSVGPQSFIEMKGGCFGIGFVGTIEEAFKIAQKSDKPYEWNEFQVINLRDVYARGWSGKNFTWKRCKKILRHAGKTCVEMKSQGVNLTITPDHSVYHAKKDSKIFRNKEKMEPKIVCASAEELKKGDFLLGDDGENFDDIKREEKQINMIDFCLEFMNKSRVTVHCDVPSIKHDILKRIAAPKTIYNWKKRGGIPIKEFIKIKPKPKVLYLTMEGSTAKISETIKLSNWSYWLGFFLGDGWIEDGGRIGFSVDEKQYDKFLSVLKDIDGVSWNIKFSKQKSKCVEIRACNKFVSSILLSIFGKVDCYNKFIPGEWIIGWDKKSKEHLLNGLIDSDGYISLTERNRERNAIVTTSYNMAKGICSILRSIGLWGSLSKREPSNGGIVNGRQIVGKTDSYIVRWSNKRPEFNRSGKRNKFGHNHLKFTESPIREIKPIELIPEWIYDLEMSGHPSFVADGILVHNSATPFREDGAEMMIQAMFGKKIVDISATYLIRNKFLIDPYIIFDPIVHKDCKLQSYQAIYKNCIVENEEFNNHVAEIANHLISRGLSVLVLVQHYPQGEYLKKLIPNTEFLTGKLKKSKRKEAIQELRDRKKLCLIATTLADEGLDIPTLDAALLAGGGASSTRVHQRIGRTLRIDKKSEYPRDKSIVVYFEHHGLKHFDKHAKKARKIIKTEPSFHIIDSGGPTLICNEIDQIMETGEEQKFSI